MSRIKIIRCDRCGADCNPVQIGHIITEMWTEEGRTSAPNPFEGMDFCEDCMQDINEFINRSTKMKPKAKRQVKGGDEPTKTRKNAVDKGKVHALYKAGWTQAKIAEEMGCSVGTVNSILKEA